MIRAVGAHVLRRVQLFVIPKLPTQPILACQTARCSTSSMTEGESRLRTLLVKKFPGAEVEVKDISGGCGSMYEIYVTSSQFKGVPTIKQHRLVQQALKEEIKDMHGLRVFTESPK